MPKGCKDYKVVVSGFSRTSRNYSMGIPMKVACGALLIALVAGVAPDAAAQELPSGPLSLAGGMVVIGTDLSVSMTPQDDTDGAWFNYTDYEHNALRLFRIGVTADVHLTDRVSILTEIRSEN